jgi:hypothetical protein
VTDSAGEEPGTDPRSADSAAVGSDVWQHATGAAYVESPDRVVVVDLDHLDLPPYVFEGSAAQVWLCVDGDRSETEIVSDLAEAYGVPLEVATPDVRHFVDRLRDLGLITLDSARTDA